MVLWKFRYTDKLMKPISYQLSNQISSKNDEHTDTICYRLINAIKTRMKTFISSEALSQLGAEKIAIPPKPDGQTDIQTDGHLLL